MVCISVTAKEILVLALVFASLFALASAYKGKIGVDYGLNGYNLPSPEQAVALIRAKGIKRVRVIETRPNVTQAFADSGIDLTIGVPNKDVPNLAASLAEAISWVLENVVPFPTSGISAIIVGNKWLENSTNDASLLVPAMQNIYSALSALELFDLFLSGIRVSTSHAFNVLKSPTFPPSNATFAEDIMDVMRPLLDFLVETESFFMVDIFPYLAYEEDFEIPIELLLFEPTEPVEDPNTGLNYTNLYDLQLDAVYSAIALLRESSSPPSSSPCACIHGDENVSTWAKSKPKRPPPPPPRRPSVYGNSGADKPPSENGTGSNRRPSLKGKGRRKGPARKYSASSTSSVSQCECEVETVENARTYNQNLIRHVLEAKGTPANPTTPLQAYIFELFDEDLNPASQQDFGIFYANGTAAYPLNFHPKL